MKKFIEIETEFSLNSKKFTIRTITAKDIEVLRQWKNKNRAFFHLKQEITPDQQENWFNSFCRDELKNIHLCEYVDTSTSKKPVACVGFRKETTLSTKAELFNLIIGEESFNGQGLAQAFFEQCRKGLKSSGHSDIWLEVLKTNTKAVEWYLRQGFQKKAEENEYWILSLPL